LATADPELIAEFETEAREFGGRDRYLGGSSSVASPHMPAVT
jgi:hypothetical protein